MITRIMAVGAICILLASGCTTSHMKQNGHVRENESKVLGAAFAETHAEWVNQKKEDLPPEVTKPDFLVQHMDMMRDNFPSLFLVTAEEETSFKAGRFHNDTNKNRMEQSIQQLSDYGVDLPAISVFLIKTLKDGKLKDAQLELAARLLSAQVENVKAMTENRNAEPTNSPDKK